jgi:hypothetical protein
VSEPTDPEHKYEMLEWSDQEVVYRLQRNETPAPAYVQAELQRRALVASTELRDALHASRRAADNASRWLIVLTVVIALLTVALVVLTAVLIAKPS